MLDGIQLDDSTSFREWATGLLPWLNEAMHYVAEGLSGDIADLLRRQEVYAGYAGRLVELYAQAEAYLVTARAEAMERQIKKGIPSSLVARLAEGEIKNEVRVYEAIHRLNSTLSDQLITLASRLKYEENTRRGYGPTPKPPF